MSVRVVSRGSTFNTVTGSFPRGTAWTTGDTECPHRGRLPTGSAILGSLWASSGATGTYTYSFRVNGIQVGTATITNPPAGTTNITVTGLNGQDIYPGDLLSIRAMDGTHFSHLVNALFHWRIHHLAYAQVAEQPGRIIARHGNQRAEAKEMWISKQGQTFGTFVWEPVWKVITLPANPPSGVEMSKDGNEIFGGDLRVSFQNVSGSEGVGFEVQVEWWTGFNWSLFAQPGGTSNGGSQNVVIPESQIPGSGQTDLQARVRYVIPGQQGVWTSYTLFLYQH